MQPQLWLRLDVHATLAPPKDLCSWWSLFRGSAPALRELGKTMVGLVPTSCADERSSFTQEYVHFLIRNGLTTRWPS